MANKILIGVVIVLAGAVFILLPKACKEPTDEGAAVWKAKYEEMVRAYDEVVAKATAEREALLITIANLQGAVDSANTVIADLEAGKATAENNLKKAREGWASFSAEAQAKLAELDAAWAAKFDILLKQGQEKDKIIFSLTAQYHAALQLGDTWKAQFEASEIVSNERGLHITVLEGRVKKLECKGFWYWVERAGYSAAGYGLGSIFGR